MELVFGLIILIFSAILHEVMHGFVADKLGDPTARIMGRLTLNPIPHIDPIMSILVPVALIFGGSPIIFGAAKPVPVNPLHFQDPKKDMALTALAGPLTNLCVAIIASVLLKIPLHIPVIETFLMLVVIYNLSLAILNLIPIPPLDGSKVFASFLPNDLARSYLAIEQFGIFILFFLLMAPVGGFSLSHLISILLQHSMRILGV